MRFDIPCIGPETVKTCAVARISVLAIEANKTLILDLETVALLAKDQRLCVTTVEGTLAASAAELP